MRMRGLEQKHERMVRNVYPPGNDVEKHPKPSELSLLMFYVTTHRGKIPQVADFLEHKASRHFSRNKIGSGMVTLEITLALVEKCNEDLSVFAPQVVNIISMAVGSPDLNIAELSGRVFEVFNKYFTGIPFAANRKFSNEFLSLVRQFADLSNTSGSQARQFRAVATRALSSLNTAPVLHTNTGGRALEIAVRSLFANIPVDEQGSAFVDNANQIAKLDELNHEFTKAGASDGSAALNSIAGLRNAFNTASAEQVVRATQSLVNGLSQAHPLLLIERLFESAAQWSQVQHRFIILNTIVEYLQERVVVSDLASQSMLSSVISSLLSSSVSMVGLSIVDFLRRILDLQHRLISYDWSNDPVSSKNEIDIESVIKAFRQAIATLARHTIYPGQITDIVSEILMKYAALPDNAPTIANEVIISDLQDIAAILDVIPSGEKVSLNGWVSTQWILSRNDPKLLSTYTRTFTSFLLLAHPVPQPFTRQGAGIARQLSLSLMERSNSSINYIAIYYCLVGLVDHLKKDATSILPWVLQIQDVGLKAESSVQGSRSNSSELQTFQGNSLVSVSQATLLAIARTVDRPQAATTVFNAIDGRVNKSQWLPGIIYPASVKIEEAISTAVARPPSLQGTIVKPEDQVTIKIGDMEPTDEEKAWGTNPNIPFEEAVTPDDLQVFKTRARSVTDSVTTGGDQRMRSSRSYSTLDLDAPTVADLRRRVSSNITAISTLNSTPRRLAAPPQVRNGASKSRLTNLLDKLEIKSDTNRGRLIV